MAHVLLFGDEAQCAPIRVQLVQWGLTVASPASSGSVPDSIGVDECDVVLVVVDAAAGRPGPDAVSDGGRGAVPAAPRLYLSGEAVAADRSREMWSSVQEACRLARERRSPFGPAIAAAGEDVHQVGHELRSPLTAIKTALEVMQEDLRTWNDEPAEIEDQLKMLQIALRNVRRLHRAVEWSQMLLAGPRADAEPLTAESGVTPTAAASGDAEAGLQACVSRAG
jgi:signal transduction histidine kinase